VGPIAHVVLGVVPGVQSFDFAGLEVLSFFEAVFEVLDGLLVSLFDELSPSPFFLA